MSDLENALVDELYDLASRAGQAAGELLRNYSGTRAELRANAETKSSLTDLATAADQASEELIVEMILHARPDDAILAEEKASRSGSSGITWVIDPLDGTTNFVYGFPPYAVSIAACREETALAGIVYDPARDELFGAKSGRGARHNNTVLTTRTGAADLSTALLGTGFSYRAAERAAQARILQVVLPAVRDVRRAGAAALDLCATAAGRLDGYFESGLKPWDKAAGLLIAAEVGLCSAELDLHEFGPTLVVGPPGLFEALIDLLSSAKFT